MECRRCSLLAALFPLALAHPVFAIACCFFPEGAPSTCVVVEGSSITCFDLGGSPAPGDCTDTDCDGFQSCGFSYSGNTGCIVAPGRFCHDVLNGILGGEGDCIEAGGTRPAYFPCCLPNGACVEYPGCPGGVSHPEATSCADVACGEPLPGTCVLGAICVEDLTIADCNAAGGYPSYFTTCDELGALNSCSLPNRSCVEVSFEECAAMGGLTTYDCGTFIRDVQWSLDIGSDAAISDPFPGNDEAGVDPAKIYRGVFGSGFGERTFDIDEEIFFYDPTPALDPNDPDSARRAPTCSGLSAGELDPEIFDIDAFQYIETIHLLYIITAEALTNPIPRFPERMIQTTHRLLISFDDDSPAHYADQSCAVPVTSTSPAGLTHGTTAARDEIVAIALPTGDPSPAPIGMAGIADEAFVSSYLAPNPDTDESADDDIDALTFGYGRPLFSSDHEAPGRRPLYAEAFDPGDIYQSNINGLSGTQIIVKIVDERIHLGVPESTDIDAFEFVWLRHPETGGDVLALLFSVDDDDPTTPGDESGGLDPRTIYRSYLTGDFAVFLGPLEDDVDAIANVLTCIADINESGEVDVVDLGEFITYFADQVHPGTNGDFNLNGTPDVFDFATILQDYGCGIAPSLP